MGPPCSATVKRESEARGIEKSDDMLRLRGMGLSYFYFCTLQREKNEEDCPFKLHRAAQLLDLFFLGGGVAVSLPPAVWQKKKSIPSQKY